MRQNTRGIRWHTKFNLNVFIVGIRWPKTTILGEFWHLGAPVSTPFYLWGPNLVRHSRPTVYAYMPNFVLISLFCRPLVAKAPKFAIFWTLAFCGIATWQQSEKVEHECTTTNLPLSNGIKIISLLQCLHGEIGCTNLDVQKHDGQTDRQTKKLDVFSRPGGGWNPSPIKHDMVVEDLEHILAPENVWGSEAQFATRGRQKFGGTPSPST